jgi:hypothetical protein
MLHVRFAHPLKADIFHHFHGSGGHYAQSLDAAAAHLLRLVPQMGFERSSYFGSHPRFKWRATADEDGHYSFAVAL